jgi:RHS repeat-associated protein
MSLSFPDASHVVVSQENGTQVTFSEEAGGKWVAPPRVTATLTRGGDGTWTFVRRRSETFTFDSSGRLTKETDLNGYTTSLAYNKRGELKKIIDPAGRTLKFSWEKGRIVSVKDQLKRIVKYEYDSAGNLVDVIDVAGGDTHFTYDSQHRMLSMRWPNQAPGVPGSTEATISNVYDEQGRVTEQTDQLGRTTKFAYSGEPLGAAGGAVSVTDPKGNVTRQTYQYGELTSETRAYGTPEAATWKFEYDQSTLGVTAVTDPNGHTTRSTYDGEGNLLTTEDALGRKTVNTYDSLNDLLTSTDPMGVTTTMTYDAHGNLLTRSRPLAGTSEIETTTYTYGDPSHPGDVTAITDAEGHAWRYSYDKYGDRTSSTDPLYDRTTSTYNVDGWKLTEISPRGNASGEPAEYTTSFSYNNFGQVVKTVDPLGRTATSEYDPDQNLVATTDPNGHTTGYSYDAADEQVAVHRPAGSTTRTTYWPDGSVKEQIDAAGHATRYDYNALGQQTAVTHPLGRTTHYTYDGVGNELTITDPEGQVTTMTYDADNEQTAISYSDGKTSNVSNITYDADGERTGMTDGTGTWSWHWDSLHRLTSVTEGENGTVSYAYDLRGLPTEITYPSEKTVTRDYDAAGRLVSTRDWHKHATFFNYDSDSNLTQQIGGGVVDRFEFNRADETTSIAATKGVSTTLFSAQYTRNADGQLTSDSSAPSSQNSYAYTALNQLCYAGSSNSEPCGTPPGGASPYKYDESNNLTQDGETTQVFDVANQLCWSVSPTTSSGSCASPPAGATSYSYDDRGNRVGVKPAGEPASTLTYDQANQLIGYEDGSTKASYAYNGDGLRMSKTVGKKSTEFTWDESEELPLLLEAGKTAYIYGPEGLPVEQITGHKPEWLQHDQLGSTRLITSQTGEVIGTYTYSPWGEVVSHTGEATTDMQFDGQYTDEETGYQYLRARYYDPGSGQFLTVDPAFAVTQSAYGFASNDPVDSNDPSGRWAVAVCGGGDATVAYGIDFGASGEVCQWVGGTGLWPSWKAETFTITGSVGIGAGGGADVHGGVEYDTSASTPKDLAGGSCSWTGSVKALAGVSGSIGCHGPKSGGVSVSGGPVAQTTLAHAWGRTYVISSSTGYTGWGKAGPPKISVGTGPPTLGTFCMPSSGIQGGSTSWLNTSGSGGIPID